MQLTIVLTVYNKALYLKRALDSLFSQKTLTGCDYEVVAVNDGSTDNSGVVLDEYSKEEPRLRIINQSNMGLSMARNNGVMASRGEYIWFVDADDIISHDAVYEICNAMQSNPDLISIYIQYDGEIIIENKINPVLQTGKAILVGREWSVCGVVNIVKKQFLIEKNIHFYPGIYHEDNEYTPRLLYLADKVVVIPKVLYTIIVEPQSITSVPRAKRAFDLIVVAKSLNSFVLDNDEVKTQIGEVFAEQISICLNNALFVIVQNSTEEQIAFAKEFANNKELFLQLGYSTQFKYRIEAFLFRLFPNKTVNIYKAIKKIERIFSRSK